MNLWNILYLIVPVMFYLIMLHRARKNERCSHCSEIYNKCSQDCEGTGRSTTKWRMIVKARDLRISELTQDILKLSESHSKTYVRFVEEAAVHTHSLNGVRLKYSHLQTKSSADNKKSMKEIERLNSENQKLIQENLKLKAERNELKNQNEKLLEVSGPQKLAERRGICRSTSPFNVQPTSALIIGNLRLGMRVVLSQHVKNPVVGIVVWLGKVIAQEVAEVTFEEIIKKSGEELVFNLNCTFIRTEPCAFFIPIKMLIPETEFKSDPVSDSNEDFRSSDSDVPSALAALNRTVHSEHI